VLYYIACEKIEYSGENFFVYETLFSRNKSGYRNRQIEDKYEVQARNVLKIAKEAVEYIKEYTADCGIIAECYTRLGIQVSKSANEWSFALDNYYGFWATDDPATSKRYPAIDELYDYVVAMHRKTEKNIVESTLDNQRKIELLKYIQFFYGDFDYCEHYRSLYYLSLTKYLHYKKVLKGYHKLTNYEFADLSFIDGETIDIEEGVAYQYIFESMIGRSKFHKINYNIKEKRKK